MRIGIDARLLSYRRGMGNYVYSLLTSLAGLVSDHTFILYVSTPGCVNSHLGLDERFAYRVLRPPIYPIWEHLSLPVAAKLDGIDLLHCPGNTAPLAMLGRTKLVVTIHDAMFMLPTSVLPGSPSSYQRLGRLYRRSVVPRVARMADRVITDSAQSRTDIMHLLGVDPRRVLTIHAAPGSKFEPKRSDTAFAFGQGRTRLLALGASDPRKNTGRIVEAFARLTNDTRSDHELVIVGLDQGAVTRFASQVNQLDLADRVTLLGFVSEDELVALYNEAEVFLYPSLYEGFGLPVLEAMACGTPVIASTAGSIPEIAGSAALLIDPTDTDALAQAMIRLTNDKELQRILVDRGHAQVAKFSWDRAARETLAVYESLA